MIPTGIYRQVPIKHWLPHREYVNEFGNPELQEVITGYYFEEAWCESWWGSLQATLAKNEQQLRAGQEVEGFVWKRVEEPSCLV